MEDEEMIIEKNPKIKEERKIVEDTNKSDDFFNMINEEKD